MIAFKDQKFFPGDTVKMTDPRYSNHHSHRVVIREAKHDWASSAKLRKQVKYRVQCQCGSLFWLTPGLFEFVPDPYTPVSAARLEHFMSELGVEASGPQPHLISLIDTLTKKQKEVITRRYGLTGLGSETLQAIADDCSLTRERVRQIEQQGMEKMTNLLEQYADRAEALAR